MDVTELVQKAAGLQGSRTPAREPGSLGRTIHKQSRQLWERSGLKDIGAEKVARGLGWFSIGLGLAELLMPRAVARICGGEGKHTGLIRLYGLREIAAGLMIFSSSKPVAGVWARVAGDAMDLATLAAAFGNPRTSKPGVLFATANVLGATAVDIMCAQQLSIETGGMTEDGAIRFKRSVSINRPAEELYRYWRDFTNLPRFMFHLQSVTETGPGTSHWVTKAPAGQQVEWDSEIVDDRRNEAIAWRSTGGDVFNAGTVEFEPKPGGRGTIVRVDMQYYARGGVAGTAVAMLFNQAPEQQVADDLRRLKQLIETGEIVRSDGSPEGTGQVMQRPAQPMGSGNSQ
jgi:uncharacterized membrane protein